MSNRARDFSFGVGLALVTLLMTLVSKQLYSMADIQSSLVNAVAVHIAVAEQFMEEGGRFTSTDGRLLQQQIDDIRTDILDGKGYSKKLEQKIERLEDEVFRTKQRPPLHGNEGHGSNDVELVPFLDMGIPF